MSPKNTPGVIFDVRHRLTLSITYAIQGKGFGQVLEGWEINVDWQPSRPHNIGDRLIDHRHLRHRWAAGEPAPRNAATLDFFGNPSDFKSGPTPIPFFAGAAILQTPAPMLLAMQRLSPGRYGQRPN